MKKKKISKYLLIFPILVLFVVGYGVYTFQANKNEEKDLTEDIYKQKLTPEQYHVLREGGTDIPFTHLEMLNNHEKGTYVTADCGEPVFRSEQKFDSGTGWPSFWAPIDESALVLRKEDGLGDNRIEVLDTCGNHLGHVFDDVPDQPTGRRYCINSVALDFQKK